MFRPGLLFALLAVAFWWAWTVFVPPAIGVELMTSLLVPIGAIGLWRWGPGSLRNLFARLLPVAKILTIAVTTLIFGAVFAGIWRLVYVWLGRPGSMTSEFNHWSYFPVFITNIAIVLYLLSTRRETDPPMPALLWLVAAGATLVLCLGIAIRWVSGTPGL